MFSTEKFLHTKLLTNLAHREGNNSQVSKQAMDTRDKKKCKEILFAIEIDNALHDIYHFVEIHISTSVYDNQSRKIITMSI
jgi:hypothetical protein